MYTFRYLNNSIAINYILTIHSGLAGGGGSGGRPGQDSISLWGWAAFFSCWDGERQKYQRQTRVAKGLDAPWPHMRTLINSLHTFKYTTKYYA